MDNLLILIAAPIFSLQQLMNQYFGADVQTVDPGLDTWFLFDGNVTVLQIKVVSFFIAVVLGVCLAVFLRKTRLGQAIRDDEDKAEAMGIQTTRYKIVAWCLSAFFLSLVGGGAGHLIGFVDPTEVAFAGPTFGVWMILMAILGGKGTLWGPVIGAVIFHVTQELFWTYFFGWQRVALEALIVTIVVFFRWASWGLAMADSGDELLQNPEV